MEKIKVCQIITKLELGGAQCCVLYTVSNIDNSKFVPVLISGKGGILDKEAMSAANFKTIFNSCLIRSMRPFRDIVGLIKMWLLLKKEKPQIVHTNSSKAGIIGRWAAWLAGVPVIIHTIHGFGFNDFQKFITKKIVVFLERITAKITDKLIVVTKEDKNKGLKYHIGTDDKYVLIRCGIDSNQYKNLRINIENKKRELGIGKGEKVITTIGPFKPQKNLIDFIKVAKLVFAETNENCKFLIIGDGEQRKQLEFQICSNKLSEKVKLLGWRRDISEILAVSDIFVMTSLWEGLPRTILEAMSSKLPVIAYGVDGVKEIIKDNINGILIKPLDVEMMSKHIKELMKNTGLSQKMGRKGFETVSAEFEISYMLKQQEMLYLELLKAKNIIN